MRATPKGRDCDNRSDVARSSGRELVDSVAAVISDPQVAAGINRNAARPRHRYGAAAYVDGWGEVAVGAQRPCQYPRLAEVGDV